MFYFFCKGKLFYGHEKFGSYFINVENTNGFNFSVWAPNAAAACVTREFNGWIKNLHRLYVRLDKPRIWEGFIPRFQFIFYS